MANDSDELHLEELLVRYWDNALSVTELEELAARLATDPVARNRFHTFSTQVVVAAEHPSIATSNASCELTSPHDATPEPQPVLSIAAAPEGKRRWTRRRALQICGGGLALGLAGVGLGRWIKGDTDVRARITAANGTVRLQTTDGRIHPPRGLIPDGATISTEGIGAAAVLTYADGSSISIMGDSAVTVDSGGLHLMLIRGTASADLRSRTDESERLTMRTNLTTLPAAHHVRLTLGQVVRSTEVEVHQGNVAVVAPTGEPLAVVREGELLTVGPNGDRHQRRTPTTPEEFYLDLNAPLPEGWEAGRRELTDTGSVLRPVSWPDPYYDNKVMQQIRSDKRWSRGFFQAVGESVIHVRYRAERSNPRSQLCLCVRTLHSRCSDTGMLEYNGGFEATAPGEWKWRHIRAVEMVHNKHAPQFGGPWVAFLIIFNTFQEDTGLQIGEFRVTPPGTEPAE